MTTAAVYLRVSLDASGEHLAVDRQRESCLKLAAERGWTVSQEYVDNSISASDRSKVRPAYDQMVEDFHAGRFDAIICWDLDRLTRQPRQLEDWIDATTERGLKLVTANGDADLSTDGGQLFASIKVSVARAEVRRKGERQTAAQQQRAKLGKPAKGIRPTGYKLTGEKGSADRQLEIDPQEAALIRRVFDGFSGGDTLKGIAARLEADGVATRRGGRWSSSSVSSILRNARYAGLSVYKGDIVGPGLWPAIVTREQFDAVQARLGDPARRTRGASTARKHLGSGVYLCECGLPVRASSGNGILTRYTCRHLCFYRAAGPVDAYVLAVIRGRLAMPDLHDLLVRPADETAANDLGAERDQIQHRLTVVEHDYDEDLIDGKRYREKRAKLLARLEEVQQKLARLVSTDASSSVLGAPDPVEAFDAAPLAVQRAVVGNLLEVTLHRGQRGVKTFDPDSVTLKWRSR